MQSFETRVHSLGFCGSDAEPEQVHLLRKRRRIRKYTVVIDLGIQSPVSKDERPARSTESANVGKSDSCAVLLARYMKKPERGGAR
ncbi:MAG: hypothetical protein WCA49_11680 [Candidatus Sulfotelmatobacter sp.]